MNTNKKRYYMICKDGLGIIGQIKANQWKKKYNQMAVETLRF